MELPALGLPVARVTGDGWDYEIFAFLAGGEGGRLRFEPLNFGVAGGDITSTLDMNASVSPMVTRADISVRRIHLKQLFEGLQFEKVTTGVIGGKARFAVNGNSVAQMLGSANGQVGLIMDGGSVSILALRLAMIAAAQCAIVFFSYGIAGFRFEGAQLLWYAGWKQHTSLYRVGAEIVRKLFTQLAGLISSTGKFLFPVDSPP